MLKHGETGSNHINAELERVISVGSAAPVNAVAATLTTALAGANNDLVFTAVTKGVTGNAITITYVDPGEETAAESVVVTDTDIVVTLRSVSAALSTAAQVKAAIDGDAEAAALVTVANADANDGTGAVIAMAQDALEGGVNGTVCVEGPKFLYYSGYLYFCPTRATVRDALWVRSQFATF